MGKKLAFWGDCNGYGYKIIRILEELGGINFSNYGGTEVTSLYYIDEKNYIKGTYNGDLDKEKYVVMTYQDFITKYPHQVYDIVYTTDNHEEGKVVEIVWDETKGRMSYLVDFENTTSWVFADDIFSYEAKDNSKCGTAIKPMKVKSNAVKFVDGKVVDNLENVNTMGKKLAIRGDKERGNEVIALLEMLGGKNQVYRGKDEYHIYFIDNEGMITTLLYNDCCYTHLTYQIFTLEEFLEKYPFKVGDKVFLYDNITLGCVTGMKWDEETVKYCVYTSAEYWCDVKELLKWNNVDLVKRHFMDNMEEKDKAKAPDIKGEDYSGKRFGYKIPDGYEFDVVVDGKIILKPIKPKYPTTYEECCKVLRISNRVQLSYTYPDVERGNVYLTGEKHLLDAFIKLRICRNAYWKIAGEQMGLDKPWEPDWNGVKLETKYVIYNQPNTGWVRTTSTLYIRILAFPNPEMRDAFYENFKDLIEQCKELL